MKKAVAEVHAVCWVTLSGKASSLEGKKRGCGRSGSLTKTARRALATSPEKNHGTSGSAAAADPSWAGRAKARVGVRQEEPRLTMGPSSLVKAASEEGGGGVPGSPGLRARSPRSASRWGMGGGWAAAAERVARGCHVNLNSASISFSAKCC